VNSGRVTAQYVLGDNEPRTVGFDQKQGRPVDLAYQEPTKRRLPQTHY